jgi:hypothetical protein
LAGAKRPDIHIDFYPLNPDLRLLVLPHELLNSVPQDTVGRPLGLGLVVILLLVLVARVVRYVHRLIVTILRHIPLPS